MDALLRDELFRIKQDQVLRFWSDLSEPQRTKLQNQLGGLDLPLIKQLIDQYVVHKPEVNLPADIQPVKAFSHTPGQDQQLLYMEAEKQGMELLRKGKVAAFLVAGGQGTRLGYEGPKGEYPVTPIKQKPLFQVFAEQLAGWSQRVEKTIPWYVMTSPINHDRTVAFFLQNKHFGHSPTDVYFFQQGVMPAFSTDGKMLLESTDSLALSPDGHGGSLRALARSGALDDMRQRSVEHLSYFQVDNPLVHIIDPLFIGLHAKTGSEMSSKTIGKAGAKEKVGNFAIADGKVSVIEYSDLPDELAEKTNPDGSLMFNAGSIAIHLISVEFIRRLTGGDLKLPWHRAEKKVPYVDDRGNTVKPETANAVKLEQFVFDAIPLARNPLVFETTREEEFSPVKNADGTDSPTTSRQHQAQRHRRWLRQAGVEVGDSHDVEISPLYAAHHSHLADREHDVDSGKPTYLE